MAGLVPAIHALVCKEVRRWIARDKPGHDAEGWFQLLRGDVVAVASSGKLASSACSVVMVE